MPTAESTERVAYVVKRYPRYSETFVVNEILAHEADGLDLEIFSLRPPSDTHFQDTLARVRASVNYLPYSGVRAQDFWETINDASGILPDLFRKLESARGEHHRDVHQAVLVAKAVRGRGIGHLHAHFATSATTVARLAAHFAGISYSFTAHAKDIFHETVDDDDLRRKLSDAAGVITVSDYNVRYLQSGYGPAGANVRRVYNGLDLTRFPFQAPGPDRTSIVAVGRLVEKKGFADLVEACAILAERDQKIDCEIIGAGPLEEELRTRIERHNLADSVRLSGPRPQQEIIQRVQEAGMFVAPCVIGEDGNRDGLPTVLLESMALGTPCISTDVTGIPEIIRDGDTGLLARQGDPGNLADAIERLLDDVSLRRRLAQRARRLIEQEFDIHRNAAAVRELFAAQAKVDAPPIRRAG